MVEILPTIEAVIPVHVTTAAVLLTGETSMRGGGPSTLGRSGPGWLTAFSTATHTQVARIRLTGELPLTITASPDGRLGYVASVSSSTVNVVDLHAWELLASLDVAKRSDPGAHGLAYIPRPA